MILRPRPYPSRLSAGPPPPKAGVSANSTTPALRGAYPAEPTPARGDRLGRTPQRRGACIFTCEMSTAGGRAERPGVIITHPNRDKAVVQATRATVVLLLLASAGLILIVTIGGWKVLESAKPAEIGYVAVYLILAFYAARWNRGVLPVAAVLAVLLLIFALVAGPAWFDRDKTGFAQPSINAGVLGLITLLIVPVQMLLRAF